MSQSFPRGTAWSAMWGTTKPPHDQTQTQKGCYSAPPAQQAPPRLFTHFDVTQKITYCLVTGNRSTCCQRPCSTQGPRSLAPPPRDSNHTRKASVKPQKISFRPSEEREEEKFPGLSEAERYFNQNTKEG